MCGIFGSVGAPLALATTKRVLASLKHRGPEAQGVQMWPGATLLHTRLRINDLTPAASQPMPNEDSGVWVTFNGEIYNFRDLRSELEALGHTFRSRSDTEVLVHGYEAWGDEVVQRLDGMFAFAIWDNHARRLLLARDRAGKKPLFYAQHNDGLCFASEMKALFAAGVPAVPTAQGITSFLAYGYVPAPQTPYEHVFELPPAHTLSFAPAGAPLVREYWQANFSARDTSPSEEEAASRVRELLTAAVKKRLVADVPVGAFLSGGFDSTAVVATMAGLGKTVKTFAIASPDPRYDESSHARYVARHFGCEHTEMQVTASDVRLLEQLTWQYDAPVGDSSAIPTYVLSRLTREKVTVALTGDGGDEVFAGYLRFGAAAASERIPAGLRPLLRWAGEKMPGMGQSRGVFNRAKRLLQATAHPLGDRMAAWTGPFALLLADLLVPDLRAGIAPALGFHRGFFPPPSHPHVSAMALVLNHNFSSYLPGDLLVKVDRCTMAHALEARSPFLDQDLVAYAMGLPDRFKWKRATSKFILRKALANVMPQRINRRGKMGFGIPLAAWFRGQLNGYVRDHLSARGARIWQYVVPEKVGALVAAHMRGDQDHSQQLWTLLALEIWLQSLEKPRWEASAA